jgi:hypothetical protein
LGGSGLRHDHDIDDDDHNNVFATGGDLAACNDNSAQQRGTDNCAIDDASQHRRTNDDGAVTRRRAQRTRVGSPLTSTGPEEPAATVIPSVVVANSDTM